MKRVLWVSILGGTLLLWGCGDSNTGYVANPQWDGQSDGDGSGGDGNQELDGAVVPNPKADAGADGASSGKTDGAAGSSDGGGTTGDGGGTTGDGGGTTGDGGGTTGDGGGTTGDGGGTTGDGGGGVMDGANPTDVRVDAPADATQDAPADSSSTTADGSSTTADGSSTTADGSSTTADGSSTTADSNNLPLDAAFASDAVVGQNDAGQYLCQTSSGTVICQCNDSLDNDIDNLIDYPADLGCLGPWDNSEMDGTTECTDGKDNDGDGLIDAADPECIGPLDNDESSFATGIPGDNKDCKQDCFFDGNSGSGDDGCEWDLRCDPTRVAPLVNECLFVPSWAGTKKCATAQSQTCVDKCLAATPNGCDCFGCCAITYGGVTKSVRMTATCLPQYINDPSKCLPCTQVAECLNPCGLCEVCIGKPAPDPSCFPSQDGGSGVNDSGTVPIDDSGTLPDSGGGTLFCPGGEPYCGPGGIDPNACPAGTYCVTGCCKPSDSCC